MIYPNRFGSNEIITESSLDSHERNNLKDSDFGLPDQRKYPLTDEVHVLQAVRFFKDCPEDNRQELAINIVNKAKEFGLEWERWNVLKHYLPRSFAESASTNGLIPVKHFPYGKVYFGSPFDWDTMLRYGEIPVPTKVLFVTPYMGIASIFTTNRNKYNIPKGSFNIGYEEWLKPTNELYEPFDEVHVIIEGDPNHPDEQFESHGYIYEIDVNNIKDSIYRYPWMDHEREFLICGLDYIKYSKKIPHKMICHVTGGPARTNFEMESYQSQISLAYKIEQIKDLYNFIKECEYGFVGPDGKFVYYPTEKVFQSYRYSSPQEFKKNKIGTCWDFCAYEYDELRSYGIKCKLLFINTSFAENDFDTHTFIIAKLDSNNFYYIEGAFRKYMGIYHIYTENEDEVVDIISQTIAQRMLSQRKEYDKAKYWVYSYEDNPPPYGCTCDEFMDHIWEHGKEIISNQFISMNTKLDSSMKMICESKDEIDLSENEHFYFYHLLPKNVHLDEYGLKTPEFVYNVEHDIPLYLHMVDKYRDRLVNGWEIYPGRDPQSLTAQEIYDGINTFRNSSRGNNQIYFFRYPPYKELGPNMTDVLSDKRIIRVDLNDPNTKERIHDIDWGHDGSFTGNKKLSRKYYENISEEEYFSRYDDNAKPLFAALNHISIDPKNGYLPITIIEQESGIHIHEQKECDKMFPDRFSRFEDQGLIFNEAEETDVNDEENTEEETDTGEVNLEEDEEVSVNLDSFGSDTDGTTPNNEYDEHEIQTLNSLISDENKAVGMYFDGAKNTKIPLLARIYADIGGEERFHAEQLMYAKSVITGEQYEPQDPDVKREYEELVNIGMDEETAMTTAIDKTNIGEDADVTDEMQSIEEDTTTIESAIDAQISSNNMMMFICESGSFSPEEMSHSIDIFMESSSIYMEDVQNVNQTQGFHPIALIFKGILAIGRLIRNLLSKFKYFIRRIAIKAGQKMSWIKKNGIKALFAKGVYMYFYDPAKPGEMDMSRDPIRYIELMTKVTMMVARQFNMSNMIRMGNFKYNGTPIPCNNLEEGLKNLKGVVLNKTKIVITENNKDGIANDFFRITEEKGLGGKNYNLYNAYVDISTILQDYSKNVTEFVSALQKMESTPGSPYYTNRAAYDNAMDALKIIQKSYQDFAKALSSDINTMIKLNNDLFAKMKEDDNKNNSSPNVNNGDPNQKPNTPYPYSDNLPPNIQKRIQQLLTNMRPAIEKLMKEWVKFNDQHNYVVARIGGTIGDNGDIVICSYQYDSDMIANVRTIQLSEQQRNVLKQYAGRLFDIDFADTMYHKIESSKKLKS